MSLRLYGTISGCGRSAGAVIPALGSGRYSPGPNIVLPSWRKGSDPHFTITVFWGQPGTLATVSTRSTPSKADDGRQRWCRSDHQSVGHSRDTRSADGRVPYHQSHA